MIYDLKLPERITRRRVITEPGCWEFQGCRRNGYGRVSVNGRVITLHRHVLALKLGLDYDDKSYDACHRCDNPPCFNPAHLFAGTTQDNIRDCAEKGRRRFATSQPKMRVYPDSRPCDVCGQPYEPHPAHRGRSKVCSKACLGKWRSRRNTETPPASKITAADAAAIRAAIAQGARGVDLAVQYGISRSTVSMIKNRRAWR